VKTFDEILILDKLSNFFGNYWPTCLTVVAEPSPVISKPFLLSGDNGAGLDQLKSLLPASPKSQEQAPKQAIRGLELGALDAVLVDGQLMPQGENFELHGVTRLEPSSKISKHS
jgi:hypothetical protein